MQYDITLQQSNIRDYWDILKRRRWIVISFCAICTVTVAVASLLMTPVYQASATIVVEGEDVNVLSAERSPNVGGVSFDIFENYLETQMAIIRSRNVAGKVFDEFRLDLTDWYKESKDPLKRFLRDIDLERLKGTRVIKVSVENPDPQMSADIANRLAEVYAQDNLRRRALTFIRNQRMASMNAEYLRLQSELDRLSNQYGPKHPAMVALREQIQAMAIRIDRQRQGGAGRIAPGGSLSEDQRFLESVLSKIQEDSVLASERMNNVIIADRAVVPIEKSKPQRKLNTIIAFCASLIGGIFLAFFIDYLDDSIKTEEDLKRLLGNIQFLGTVPFERDQNKRHKVERLVYLRPHTILAEAYRILRIGILWFSKKGTGIRDFAILSPRPGDGKTTLASNVAIALSQVKNNVLLVDADIRRGRLHQVYKLSNDAGLGHYLTEDYSVDDVIQKTDIPNLSFVSCGDSIINPSELMDSPKMTEFIEETRKRFDLIVYDTPPITLLSDTAALISQLNGVLLAVRSGVTSARLLPKTFSVIKNANTQLIGVTLYGTALDNKKHYHKYYRS